MNSLLEERILEIISKYYDFFFKNNVVAIGLGEKFIENINTNELCLKIFVEKKIPENNLLKKDLLPKEFLGVKLDVIETGKIITSSMSNSDPTEDPNGPNIPKFKTRLRPIQAGCNISQYKKKDSGTLGAIVFDNNTNNPFILSNNHVLVDYSNPKKLNPILQPSAYYGGLNNLNLIAMVNRYVPIKTTDFNLVDCATAKILPYVQYTKIIYNIGEILGVGIAKPKKRVRKVGAKTGYTEGAIFATNITSYTLSEDGKKQFFNNLISTSKMSDTGDSGSVYIDYNNKAIGLGMASSDYATFLNPISIVLNFLNVHF